MTLLECRSYATQRSQNAARGRFGRPVPWASGLWGACLFFQSTMCVASCELTDTGTEPTNSGRLTREALVHSLQVIRGGETTDAVRALLGPPDDITMPNEPFVGDVSSHITWAYGTTGHCTFATTGRVYFDAAGIVVDCRGGQGRGLPPEVISDRELRDILTLLATCDSNSDVHFPMDMIRVVNRLWPLGAETALRILGEYERIHDGLRSSGRCGQFSFYVPRVLFDLPNGVTYFPIAQIGVTHPPPPVDIDAVPRFPVSVIMDIPVKLTVGEPTLFGRRSSLRSHLNWYRQNARIRTAPLRPTDKPFDVCPTITKLMRSIDGIDSKESRELSLFGSLALESIAQQLTRLVESAYRIGPYGCRGKVGSFTSIEQRLVELHQEVSAVKMRWDFQKQCYIRPRNAADGSREWHVLESQFALSDGTGLVIVCDRQRTESIDVTARWSECTEGPTANASVEIWCPAEGTGITHRLHLLESVRDADSGWRNSWVFQTEENLIDEWSKDIYAWSRIPLPDGERILISVVDDAGCKLQVLQP